MQNKYACTPCNRPADMCTYSGGSGTLVMTGAGNVGDRWRAVQSDWFLNRQICVRAGVSDTVAPGDVIDVVTVRRSTCRRHS